MKRDIRNEMDSLHLSENSTFVHNHYSPEIFEA